MLERGFGLALTYVIEQPGEAEMSNLNLKQTLNNSCRVARRDQNMQWFVIIGNSLGASAG